MHGAPIDGTSSAMRLLVEPEFDGRRLDHFLVARVPHMSRARAKRFVAEGWVRVNGRRARKARLLRTGDLVSLQRTPPPVDFAARPSGAVTLTVLYEDAHCVVVDKPAGVPTHPLRPDETGTVASALVHRYPEMASVGYRRREPGILHRLDTGTSGVLLAARTAAAFETLRALLRAGRIDKRYQLLCDGHAPAPEVVSFPLARRDAQRVRACRDAAEAARLGGQDARTELVRATPVGPYSFVEARASSARRHQVRVHLAAIGHPLLGDLLYGGPAVAGLERHALHASSLAFEAPWASVEVAAPLAADLAAILAREPR